MTKTIATCGSCGLSWNDGKSTSITPVPSGRCPFEYFHKYGDEELEPKDIPPTHPVQPI